MIPFPLDQIQDEDAALDWWENDFACACDSMGVQVNAAALARKLVASIREIRTASHNYRLSLKAAALESGFSTKQISRWLKDGKIENVGTVTAPRVRRGDVINRRVSALPPRVPIRIMESAQDIARSVANSDRSGDG